MNIKLIISPLFFCIFFVLEGIYPHFKGRCRRIKHALPNLIIASLNGLITQGLFLGMMMTVMNWSKTNSFGFLQIIQSSTILKGIVAFILFDLWMYLWHRANHKILFLWRFHRVHHTDIAERERTHSRLPMD